MEKAERNRLSNGKALKGIVGQGLIANFLCIIYTLEQRRLLSILNLDIEC